MILSPGKRPELKWELDFEPERVVIINENKDDILHAEASKTGSMDAVTFFSYINTQDDLRLRAYYGDGMYYYVDSAVFKHTATYVTKQPVGGYVVEGGELEVSWDVSFKPEKQELLIFQQGTYDMTVKPLNKDARSVKLNGRGVDSYYVRFYIFDDQDVYFTTQSFRVAETGREIHTVTCDDPNVGIYNPALGSESINAADGDKVSVSYWKDDFVKWDSAASGVKFAHEDRNSTTFEMPTKDVKIYVKTKGADGKLGDVNNDGSINVSDISKVAAHVKNKKSLTAEEMKLADVNGDNAVTVTDVSKIAAHVKGIKSLF